MKALIEVKYKSHKEIELTNSNGDTFTSTSEELQDFFSGLKPFKFDLPAVMPQLLCVQDALADLTIGVKYEMLKDDYLCYLLIGDKGKKEWYTKTRFEVLPTQ